MFSLSVVDYAYQRATQRQKRCLLLELYSAELQLFKDLTVQSSGNCRFIQYTSWNPGHVFLKFSLLFMLSVHLIDSGNMLELCMSFAVLPCVRIIWENSVIVVTITRCIFALDTNFFLLAVNPNVHLFLAC